MVESAGNVVMPEGPIQDFITGEFRKDTPKECVRLGNQKIQEAIHSKVDHAFRLRNRANVLEQDAQKELLKRIHL